MSCFSVGIRSTCASIGVDSLLRLWRLGDLATDLWFAVPRDHLEHRFIDLWEFGPGLYKGECSLLRWKEACS